MEVEKGFMKVFKSNIKRVVVGLSAVALILTSSRMGVNAYSIGLNPGNLVSIDQWDKFSDTKDYLEKYFKNYKVDILKFDNIFVFYDKDGDGVYNKQGQTKDVPLSGVKVSINHWWNPTQIYPFTYSQVNGKARLYFPVFNGLKDGYYLSVEVPNGYEINVTEDSLFGKDGNTAFGGITYKIGNGEGNGQGHGNLLTFAGRSEIMIPLVKKQAVEKADLTISSNDYNNVALKGVNYDLYTYTGGAYTKTDSASTDENGKAVFKDIPVGSNVYVKATNLEELKLKAAEGIGSDSLSSFISINKGQNDLAVKLLKTSSISLKQSYLSTGESVATPITYELYDILGDGNYQYLGEAISDNKGEVTFSNIVVGKHVFVKAKDVDYSELQPVEGLGNADAQSAPIEVTETVANLEVKYQKTSSLVVKSKLNNNQPISRNLTYALYDITEDGSSKLISQKGSQNGADVVFDEILVGKQVYVELVDYSKIQYKSMSGLGHEDGKSAPIAIQETENVFEAIYY